MVQYAQKYTIVQLFEDIEEGYVYSSTSWPLHSTIVDTFALKWSIDEMVAKLTDALKHHTTVDSEVGDDRFFGDNGQVQVALLGRTDSLIRLHLDVLAALKDGELALNDPQFAHDGFLPHATIQKHARLNKGDKVLFTALSIIDMFPNEDPNMRKVLKTIKIG